MTQRPRFTTDQHPVSDHCDGVVFFNPPLPDDWRPAPRPEAWPEAREDETLSSGEVPAPKPRSIGRFRFLRWVLSSTTQPPPQMIDPAPPGDPFAEPAPGAVGVTFIGHTTFLLRIRRPDGGLLTMITDPIFSERCSPVPCVGPRRLRPPGRRLDELPPVDIVLVSHAHYDHLDLPSLRALARRDNPVVVTPLGNGDVVAKAGLHRVRELDWWDSAEYGGACFTCTPARHFSQRTPFDGGKRLWGGLMVNIPQPGGFNPISIYFAGDSAHGPHWGEIKRRLGSPFLAFLPIGAYAPRSFLRRVHVDPVEAVDAFRALDAHRAFAMHFGTFPLSQEPLGEPERCLAETVAWAGLAPDAFTPLAFGESRVVPVQSASDVKPAGL